MSIQDQRAISKVQEVTKASQEYFAQSDYAFKTGNLPLALEKLKLCASTLKTAINYAHKVPLYKPGARVHLENLRSKAENQCERWERQLNAMASSETKPAL